MVLIPSRLIKEEPIEDEEAEESQISLNRPSEDQQIGFVLPDEEELQVRFLLVLFVLLVSKFIVWFSWLKTVI